MNWDIVGAVLGSFGGATVIVTALAHFFGKIWADRIATATKAKFEQELEVLKIKSNITLEEFKRRSDAELKDRDNYYGITSEIYQDFFKNRIKTYLKLLEIKNQYISYLYEDFFTEQDGYWGSMYYDLYRSFRNIIIEDQLYISNDLEKKFVELQIEAAKYTKEGDRAEDYAIFNGIPEHHAIEHRESADNELADNTYKLMKNFISQIEIDVSKLRSRIEIDKV